MLLVKENISKYIKTEKVSLSKLVLWFTISSKITCFNENIHCDVVYIPPISSKYAHDEPFFELEREILRHCNDSKRIILIGDFNARTAPKMTMSNPIGSCVNIADSNKWPTKAMKYLIILISATFLLRGKTTIQ